MLKGTHLVQWCPHFTISWSPYSKIRICWNYIYIYCKVLPYVYLSPSHTPSWPHTWYFTNKFLSERKGSWCHYISFIQLEQTMQILFFLKQSTTTYIIVFGEFNLILEHKTSAVTNLFFLQTSWNISQTIKGFMNYSLKMALKQSGNPNWQEIPKDFCPLHNFNS